jgi:hypothetical protein
VLNAKVIVVTQVTLRRVLIMNVAGPVEAFAGFDQRFGGNHS